MAYDDSNDSITVSGSNDSGGRGTGPEGNGDSRDNGVGDITVVDNPNSSISLDIAPGDGNRWTMTFIGLAIKDPNKMETKIEGFVDLNDKKKGGNSTEKNAYNRNLPVKDAVVTHKLSNDYARHYNSINRDIKKSKFDSTNRINFYHHGYNYSVQLNDDGKFTDYKEQETGKTKNMDMMKYKGLGDAKRKEMVTKLVELEYKTQSSEIRDFSIDVLDFNYNIKINKFGVLVNLKKTKYSKVLYSEKKEIARQKKELESKGVKTDADLDQYLISFTNTFFNNYEKNKSRVKQLEKDTLLDASAMIVDSGEKLSVLLGKEYKVISDRIANDVKNFQGKKIRSFNDALKDLDKVLKNPNFKVSKQDRNAIANATKQIHAKTLSDNFYRLGKAFKVLDAGLKIEKVWEKTAEGFDTGNWKPLMLEVEAMILSGYTASLALSITFSTISSIASILALGTLPVALASIAAIILISYLSSLIDASLVDKINHELIRVAQ